MPETPARYVDRLRQHSQPTRKGQPRDSYRLSPTAVFIAWTIADLRWRKNLKPHEPLPLSRVELAAACGGMSPNTLDKYLAECERVGWVRVDKGIYRDGRQQKNRYFTADPTARTESTRVEPVLTPRVDLNRSTRVESVLRSKNYGGTDDAALRGGGGPDEQRLGSDAPLPLSPAAPLGGAALDTDPVGATRAELDALIDEPRQADELEALAAGEHPRPRPTAVDPLSIDCPESRCVAKAGEPCPGFRLKGIPHLLRRTTAYGLGAA